MLDQIKEIANNAIVKEEKGYITVDVSSMADVLKEKKKTLDAGKFEFILGGAITCVKVNSEEMWRILNE